MKQLAKAGMTMLVVSHEMGFAREAANRAVFMYEGRILEEGSPQDIFNSPRHERTRQFFQGAIGAENILPVTNRELYAGI